MPEDSDGQGPRGDEMLRSVLESMRDVAIFTMDGEGRVTSWSRGAERVLGHSPDAIIGSPGASIFTPEDRAAGAHLDEMATALREGRAEDERWHIRSDGRRFWSSGLLMPLEPPSSGFVKVLRDRTERHEAEQRVRENEERFRLLATSIPQLVFRSRGSGSRTWGSPQWEIFTGLDGESSREFGWLEAVHPEDREATLAAWTAAADTGEYYAEHRIRRAADGEHRWHQTRARRIEGEDDWVGTSTDIHDLRGLQERQQILMAELQHRTRNLLALVQAIARQTLRSDGATLEQFGQEFTSRLRALSRVQAMLGRAGEAAVDMRALVESELAAHRSDRLSDIVVEGPDIEVPAGFAQTFALALHELATNAVKHGAFSVADGRLSVVWRVEREEKRERLVLEWRESGVPMAPRPKRRGFGSELIERALPYQLNAATRLEHGPDGVRCLISIPLSPDPEKLHD